jgi:hypothetical protein
MLVMMAAGSPLEDAAVTVSSCSPSSLPFTPVLVLLLPGSLMSVEELLV